MSPEHPFVSDQSFDPDPVFSALADSTRRAIIEQLAFGPASVTALFRPHAMALPSFLRHIEVLEHAGLVASEKTGRTRMVTLVPDVLAPIRDWLGDQGLIDFDAMTARGDARAAATAPKQNPHGAPAAQPKSVTLAARMRAVSERLESPDGGVRYDPLRAPEAETSGSAPRPRPWDQRP